MAHLAVGFMAVCLLIPVLTWPPSAPLLILPVLASAMIARWRTVADSRCVTARTLLGSRSVNWDTIAGLGFTRGSWAQAHLNSGERVRLPAVTFSALPHLTEVSGHRVPNPYG